MFKIQDMITKYSYNGQHYAGECFGDKTGLLLFMRLEDARAMLNLPDIGHRPLKIVLALFNANNYKPYYEEHYYNVLNPKQNLIGKDLNKPVAIAVTELTTLEAFALAGQCNEEIVE